MKSPNHHSLHVSHRADGGFAIVVVLMFMIVIAVCAVGLLSLASVTLRSSEAANARSAARANAKVALVLAIGELQKNAGPDQRATMTSSLVEGPAPANPNWTGTIDVSKADPATSSKSAKVSWLVSGDMPDPSVKLVLSPSPSKGHALSLGKVGSGSAQAALLAPAVTLDAGSLKGRHAWWIGDEGTKARIDLARPKASLPTRENLVRSQAPTEPNLAQLGPEWSDFGPAGRIDKTLLVSIGTSGLAANKPTIPSDYFDDLTSGGCGLPTNIHKGGMKADLSLVFDQSQVSKAYGSRYFGATPSTTKVNGATMLEFNPTDGSKFFLSDSLSKNGTLPVGPNWGILWNYANQWTDPGIASQQATLVGPNPPNRTDIHFKDWLPYTNSDKSTGPADLRTDKQHTNSPLAPVVSMLQMSFRFSSEKMPPSSGTPGYKAQVTMQPVIGIWNPYNVAIKSTSYVLDWALYPYLILNFGVPLGNNKYGDTRYTQLWMREEWSSGSYIPTASNPTAMSCFSVQTDPVDLQPGEFRLFSATDKTPITKGAGVVYKLKPGWNETGGFVVTLKDGAGNPRIIPSGHRAWFGDIRFQDTQASATLSRYPSLNTAKVAPTFVCLKAMNPTENILYRATGLWNNENNTSPLIPEPVVSASSGGPDSAKPSFLIDDIDGDKVLAHIATWSFISRTTRQVEDVNQRLRGWIDTNPRALASNPSWDGSRTSSSGAEGWNMSSQFIGVYNPPGKPKQLGDGFGGNRGLLGEGGNEIYEPEVNVAGGRYQGFGGAANTSAGQNRVVIYDVPRAPLSSIGQFQHAQLSRYNFEPGFIVGNSYANVRIPLAATVNPNFAGINGLTMVDTSYEVNRRLWDDFYFSTLSPDVKGSGQPSFDKAFDMAKLTTGETPLPNPRISFQPFGEDSSLDKILAESGDRAPEAIAARTMVKGAFNVNSTSKVAWKAVLSSMGASQLPVIDSKGALSWENPEGIRFNRFGAMIDKIPYEAGGDGESPEFWQGWRKLSADELDKLAAAMVQEVKARGPFRSLAEFVNRNPHASSDAQRRKGALQAAIDRTVNSGLPESVGLSAANPKGTQYSAAIDGESQAAGGAGYLLQGDVLQSLGPVLQARSDYFKIRTCGEAVDANGYVTARAWCEAFVQRTNRYLDETDPAFRNAAELTSPVNKAFGRRLEVVSFRWLSPDEI